MIRAQNYTQVPAGTVGAGTTLRNVIITNKSSVPLFSFTTGDVSHCGLSGVSFIEGDGDGAHISVSGSGSNVVLINDIYMTVRERYYPADPPIKFNAIGGVIWNLVATGVISEDVGTFGGGLLIKSHRNWNTASTIGLLDAFGNINVYLEDSTIINCGQWPDIDDNGRFVARHCVFDGTWGLTHGFTSTWGGRHFEYYNNVFSVTYNVSPWRNMAGRYFWCRAGSGLFTDNIVNAPFNTQQWGNVKQLSIGDTAAATSYPMDRQPGFGHDGVNNISDPIYLWNQTGGQAYTYAIGADWTTNVVINRDIFVNNGSKPSYTKYTYPHPLRNLRPIYYFPFRKP
jgi:hypothetical protein